MEDLQAVLSQDPALLLNSRPDSVGPRAVPRDILRAAVGFLETFLEDGVKEVYTAALQTLPTLFQFTVWDIDLDQLKHQIGPFRPR